MRIVRKNCVSIEMLCNRPTKEVKAAEDFPLFLGFPAKKFF